VVLDFALLIETKNAAATRPETSGRSLIQCFEHHVDLRKHAERFFISTADEKFGSQGNSEARSDPNAAKLAEKMKEDSPRPHVIDAYRSSLEEFAPVYTKLAD